MGCTRTYCKQVDMQALYRLYRPVKFADLIGQEHVSTTIQNQYAGDRLAHAYLFTGPRGVGKTTTARLIAKLVNCEQSVGTEPCNNCSSCTQIASGSALDVYEIDAASNTDVEHVRENIIKSVRFAPNQLKKKIFIIDEVHMLSTSAFNALLKTLEEPPGHVLFILATTEIHKVPETIVSRCQRFDFKRIPKEQMMQRLKSIAQSEKIEIDEDVLARIVKQSDGCARDAESLLGQILALADKHVTMQEASLVLPVSTEVFVESFLKLLLNHDAKTSIFELNTFLEQGVDLKVFLEDVISTLRDRLFEDETGFIRQALTSLLDAKLHIRSEHLPQLPVELAIINLCTEQNTTAAGHAQKKPTLPEVKKSDFKKQGVDSSPPISDIPKQSKAQVKETVFDSIPVISLDEVKEKWPQVFDQIKDCHASLPLLMQSCEICQINGEQVELGFDYDLYVDTINKDKNRKVIEQVLARVLGKTMRVKAIKKKIQQEDLVADLIQQFGGTVQ